MNRYALCATLLLCTLDQPAAALTLNWNTNLGGSFTTASNWTDSANSSNHVVPSSNDTAVFDRNFNVQYNVTFPGRPIVSPLTYEVHQLIIGTNGVGFLDSVNLNQLPAALAIDPSATLANGALTIGDSAGDTAVLSTTLADFSAGSVTIGNAAGSTGTLALDGGNLRVIQSGSFPFKVGRSGSGSFNISNGAHALTADAILGEFGGGVGVANVIGAGSTWNAGDLTVGNTGAGTLTIAAGGSVSSNVVALGSGGGALTVTGAGSMLSSNLLEARNGDIHIQDGGHVASSFGRVGGSNTPSVDVGGNDSLWTNGSSLSIGRGGQGTAAIHNGGQVTATTIYIGELVVDQFGTHPGQGTATVDGSDSMLVANGDNLYLGVFGTGDLTVTNGARAVVTGGALAIGSQGTLSGNSSVAADVMNGGVVAPGTSAGALHVNGNYSQSVSTPLASIGTLQMELGGTSPGVNYDQLLVSGSFTATGTLAVSLVNAFTPQAGDSFNILDFASMSGTFTNLQLPSLATGLSWDPSQLYATGVLSVVAVGTLGDYNNNGTVDAADYVLWRNGGPLANEVDNPGTVNAQDYIEWRQRFGNTTNGAATSLDKGSAVPEPTVQMLALFAIATAWLSQRHRAG